MHQTLGLNTVAVSPEPRETSLEAAATRSTTADNLLSRVLDRTVFPILLLIIASIVIPHPRVEFYWDVAFPAIIFSLYALRLLEVVLSGNWRIKCLDLLVPLFLLTLFAFLQTLPLQRAQNPIVTGSPNAWWAISADPYETGTFAVKLLAFVLTGELLCRYTSNERRLQVLTHLAIFCGIASALGLTIQRWMQPDLAQTRSRLWQFGNPNHFAFLMEITLGLLLGLILGGAIRRNRVLIYAAMSLWAWAGLLLTGSRGGIIGMFGQLLFVAVLFPIVRLQTRTNDWTMQSRSRRVMRAWLLRPLMLAILLVAVAAGVVWQGGDALSRRLETVSSEISAWTSDSSAGGVHRAAIWRATWELIKANPIAGSGFGGYWIAISQHYQGTGELVPYQVDNDYLELLASGGIIGAFFVAWFLFAFIRRASRQLRRKNSLPRSLCFGALAGIVGVAIHSAFDFGLHHHANALMLVVLIVLATTSSSFTHKYPKII